MKIKKEFNLESSDMEQSSHEINRSRDHEFFN